MTIQFKDKTVIISGGAGGIGLALAKEFGGHDMNVVIADIDKVQLQAAEKSLSENNIKVLACDLDVTNFDQWNKVVSSAKERFGNVHMLINNAGVGGIPSTLEESSHEAWRWVIDVNLMGVVYGAQAVIPALKEHGEGGWIINVASMAGMEGVPYADSYCATKAAVVSLSESWAGELKPFGINVSALCPAFVKTQIHKSHRNMQDKYKAGLKISAKDEDSSDFLFGAAAMVEAGIPAALLAKRVVEGIVSKQKYIFTHPNYGKAVTAKSERLEAAFTNAKESSLVGYLMDEDAASL
jgi:NAD(P)-dependent dehydrogenase (short-subunit alcohol dehydrogenase family)